MKAEADWFYAGETGHTVVLALKGSLPKAVMHVILFIFCHYIHPGFQHKDNWCSNSLSLSLHRRKTQTQGVDANATEKEKQRQASVKFGHSLCEVTVHPTEPPCHPFSIQISHFIVFNSVSVNNTC